jgi:hypothetical protein
MTKFKYIISKILNFGVSKYLLWALLFFISNLLLYSIPTYDGDFIFEYYTLGYFKSLGTWLHVLFGFFPFSFGDFLYILTSILILYLFGSLIIQLYTKNLKQSINRLSKLIALILFIFVLIGTQWNWNYLQSPLDEKLDLGKSTYQKEKLITFTKKIVELAEKYRKDSDFSLFEDRKGSIIDISLMGYDEIESKYIFKPGNVSVKYSQFSSILPYFGISGYYNPFTAEAQVVKGIPLVQVPFVINHEAAHQIGIASESEANFIGFLTSANNPLSTIKYSGYVNLLMYCLSDLRRLDNESYQIIVDELPTELKVDINSVYEFWKSYRNEYRFISDFLYDMFLKYNKQSEGLKSYNQVVNLAMQYDIKNPSALK